MIVITQQIKAARALLNWEQFDLAMRAGVCVSTIRRLERLKGSFGANFETLEKIRRACETAGLEFVGYPKPGVILSVRQAPPLDPC
jgi:transcriptional regulator with XRE-family HTH domain